MFRKRLLLAKLFPYYTRLRHPGVFENVRNFCLFVGHGRSGSSIVGALLNAHPDIVLSNELNVLEYAGTLSQEQLFNLILLFSKRQARRGSPGGGGYSYAVPNQWQGRHKEIRVIGDRKAGATAIQLLKEPELLGKLRETIAVPLKFICVTRNPFDTLATTLKKTIRHDGETAANHLERQIEYYFERCEGVNRLFEELGPEAVRVVSHESLVADASSVLAELCRYLDVAADADYLRDCAAIVNPRPHITRGSIEWPTHLLDEVRRRAGSIPWLQGYRFEESP